MKYLKRKGARIAKSQVKVIAKEVNKLIERDGVAKAETLVEEAKAKTHPLHDLFEWDDTAAAVKWRVHQARYFIGCVQVDMGTGPISAFVSARPTYAAGVVPIHVAVKDVDIGAAMRARAAMELEIWTRRYALLDALCAGAVRKVRRAAKDLRTRRDRPGANEPG